MKKHAVSTGLALIITVSVFISGCGSSGQGPSSGSTAQQASSAAADESSVQAVAEAKSESTSAETVPAEDHHIIEIVSHEVQINRDGVELAMGTYPELVLTDEYATAHRELRESLESFNSEIERKIVSDVSEFGEEAEERLNDKDQADFFKDMLPLSSKDDAQLLRLDEQVLVIADLQDIWGGGAHPYSCVLYNAWDVNTGKKLNNGDYFKHEAGLAQAIYDELKKDYSDNEELMENDPTGTIDGFITDKTLNCAPWGGKLTITFNQYDIASYASGSFEVDLTPEEYGVYLNKPLMTDNSGDVKALVKYSNAEPREIEPGEEISVFKPSCPSWKHYCVDGREAFDSHVALTETHKNTTEWLNTDSWESSHGFKKPKLPYSDGTWIYEATAYREYPYMTDAFDITNVKTEKTISFYLDNLLDGPDEDEHTASKVTQYLRYAICQDDIVYVSIGHNMYSSNEKNSNYIAAIDIKTGNVVWKSDPLVSNAMNFILTDTTVICGYGFTAEDDFIYELDKNTGETVATIPVKSGPDEFQIVDDTLYVATYNTEYEFKMSGS